MIHVIFLTIIVVLWFAFWFFVIECKPKVSYYTTDGHKLAPHPNMTDEDLDEYESYFGK